VAGRRDTGGRIGGPGATLFAAFLGLLSLACADGMDRVCNADADCASGACRPDGTCEPPAAGDAGGGVDGAVHDAGPAPPDAGRDAGVPDVDAGPAGCVPDRDGVIRREEVPLGPGLRATFRVARDARFDTAGEPLGDGMRRWDVSGDLAGDHDVLVETRHLDGAWYADDFPGASYASRLSDGEDLLGVFELTGASLLLRGVVSPEGGLDRTNVSHDPEVETLSFPLELGARWSTDATVTGISSGVVATWRERYESEVDARGELETPFGTFDVLRVRVVLRRTVGVVTKVVRTYLFVSECFGTVASIVSRDDEPREEFTRASELRRIAP